MKRALLLGLLHGPAELLPVSSSAHVALLPWLAGWTDDGVSAESSASADAELRKSLEVALHAGTAAALVLSRRRDSDPGGWRFLVRSAIPPAIVGLTLERPIERRLGRPAGITAGLLAGSALMVLAELRPGPPRRHPASAPVDGWLLGAAQALALAPGISRSGATRAAARLRGFTREEAALLSERAALPVIAGASALKLLRLVLRRPPAAAWLPLVVGAGGAFASTALTERALARRAGSLLPFALYRSALAALVIRRLRQDGRVSAR